MRMFWLTLAVVSVMLVAAETARAQGTAARSAGAVSPPSSQDCPLGGPRQGLGWGLRDGSGPGYGYGYGVGRGGNGAGQRQGMGRGPRDGSGPGYGYGYGGGRGGSGAGQRRGMGIGPRGCLVDRLVWDRFVA